MKQTNKINKILPAATEKKNQILPHVPSDYNF